MYPEHDLMDALESEHAAITDLLDELLETERVQGRQRTALLERLKEALVDHAEGEREILYPALAKATGATHLAERSAAQHAEVMGLVEDLELCGPHSSEWRDRVEDLRDVLLHHVEAEEQDAYALARERLSPRRRRALAEALDELRTAPLAR